MHVCWPLRTIRRDHRLATRHTATPIARAGVQLAKRFQNYPHDKGQNQSVALAQELADHFVAAVSNVEKMASGIGLLIRGKRICAPPICVHSKD